MGSKSVSVTIFQYLVCPPLLSMIAWIRYGMLDTRDSQYSCVIWAVPSHSSTYILFFFRKWVAGYLWSVSRSAIFHEDRAVVDVHLQFQLLYEQFHILGSIHNGVKRNEIQTSSATANHGTQYHLARWVFHCGYNIFLGKMLTQWPPNVHVAKYKLLHGAFFHSVRVQWQARRNEIHIGGAANETS